MGVLNEGLLVFTTLEILVNCCPKGWVEETRGLRQENPLSPFLFTIATDVSSRMMLRLEKNSFLEDFLVGRSIPRLP